MRLVLGEVAGSSLKVDSEAVNIDSVGFRTHPSESNFGIEALNSMEGLPELSQFVLVFKLFEDESGKLLSAISSSLFSGFSFFSSRSIGSWQDHL